MDVEEGVRVVLTTHCQVLSGLCFQALKVKESTAPLHSLKTIVAERVKMAPRITPAQNHSLIYKGGLIALRNSALKHASKD